MHSHKLRVGLAAARGRAFRAAGKPRLNLPSPSRSWPSALQSRHSRIRHHRSATNPKFPLTASGKRLRLAQTQLDSHSKSPEDRTFRPKCAIKCGGLELPANRCDACSTTQRQPCHPYSYSVVSDKATKDTPPDKRHTLGKNGARTRNGPWIRVPRRRGRSSVALALGAISRGRA